MSQKHIYWKKCADAKFRNRITVISLSLFYATTFKKKSPPKMIKYRLWIMIKRCLQKESGVSYDTLSLKNKEFLLLNYMFVWHTLLSKKSKRNSVTVELPSPQKPLCFVKYFSILDSHFMFVLFLCRVVSFCNFSLPWWFWCYFDQCTSFLFGHG